MTDVIETVSAKSDSDPANRPATSKRAAKREAILAIGAELMNRLGPGGVRLGDVASKLGLSRNALYYYVRDRQALAFQCYRQTCSFIDSVIARHRASSAAPDESVRAIICDLLTAREEPFAVISDAAILAPDESAIIRTAMQDNVASLSHLLADGIARRHFRPVDPDLVSRMILGMANWAILWRSWTAPDGKVTRESLEEAAAAIAQTVIFGSAVGPAQAFEPARETSDQLVAILKPAAYDGTNLVPARLIASASLLFNRYGPESVTLDEVAAYAEVTKGAIYHHFADKRDLVMACYERAFKLQDAIIDLADASEDSAFRKLLAMFYFNSYAHAGMAPPLALNPGLLRLPDKFLRDASELVRRMREAYHAASTDGSLRAVDPSIVELTAGSFFWMQTWRLERPDLSDAAIAKSMTAIINEGISAAK